MILKKILEKLTKNFKIISKGQLNKLDQYKI